MIEQITNYSELNSPPFLVEIFRETNIAIGILEAFDEQYNELEQTFFDLKDDMWIATAVGAQLDVLGVHLGISRLGLSDEVYQGLLYGKAAINAGNPTPEALISAIKLLYNAVNVTYIPVYPAKLFIDQDGEIIDQSLIDILPALIPSGVGFFITGYLLLDDGVGEFKILLDDGSSGGYLQITNKIT